MAPNFCANRAIQGYYESVGRVRAGFKAFDYELELLVDENGRVVQPIYRDGNGQITPEVLAANAGKVKFRDLPPLADEGARSPPEMWANVTYFLRAAVPVAEKRAVTGSSTPKAPRD